MNNRVARPQSLVIGAMAIAAVLVSTMPDRAGTAGATNAGATTAQPETRAATAPAIILASSSLAPHAVTGGS